MVVLEKELRRLAYSENILDESLYDDIYKAVRVISADAFRRKNIKLLKSKDDIVRGSSVGRALDS